MWREALRHESPSYLRSSQSYRVPRLITGLHTDCNALISCFHKLQYRFHLPRGPRRAETHACIWPKRRPPTSLTPSPPLLPFWLGIFATSDHVVSYGLLELLELWSQYSLHAKKPGYLTADPYIHPLIRSRLHLPQPLVQRLSPRRAGRRMTCRTYPEFSFIHENNLPVSRVLQAVMEARLGLSLRRLRVNASN